MPNMPHAQDHALPVPKADGHGRSGGALRDLLHRLDQRLHARRPEGGGTVPRPWRVVRHRHHRDPACPRISARGSSPPPGSAEKCAACERLGAEAINYREADFVEILRAEGGANLILDMVGGPYLPRNVKALADDGRLVQIAFLQGPKVELNFAQVMMRRLTITGSTLRPQSDAAKARHRGCAARTCLAIAGVGRVAPVMDRVFALEDAAAAHARMESSAHIGKIVLQVG
jgi:hypothetical protein